MYVTNIWLKTKTCQNLGYNIYKSLSNRTIDKVDEREDDHSESGASNIMETSSATAFERCGAACSGSFEEREFLGGY